MKKKQVILVGGGGHCKSCIDVIEQTGLYDIAGIIDLPEKLGQSTLGYEVIGSDDEIKMFAKQGYCFLVTLGQIKSATARIRLFAQLKEVNAEIETIISPRAYVSHTAKIGQGTIVMHGATVISSALIGENCIVNSGCTVEHDAIIGDHCHISTHSVVNGECEIGDEVFIGSHATVINQITICDRVVIGAAAVVHKTVSAKGTYVGNPAKKI